MATTTSRKATSSPAHRGCTWRWSNYSSRIFPRRSNDNGAADHSAAPLRRSRLRRLRLLAHRAEPERQHEIDRDRREDEPHDPQPDRRFDADVGEYEAQHDADGRDHGVAGHPEMPRQ